MSSLGYSLQPSWTLAVGTYPVRHKAVIPSDMYLRKSVRDGDKELTMNFHAKQERTHAVSTVCSDPLGYLSPAVKRKPHKPENEAEHAARKTHSVDRQSSVYIQVKKATVMDAPYICSMIVDAKI